nr:hypothetical protein [Cobetia sp. Dlab-2-AX]
MQRSACSFSQQRIELDQLILDQQGTTLQPLQLGRIQLTGLVVDQAQSPQRQAAAVTQHGTRVEADMRWPRHQGVIKEALILTRIIDDQKALFMQRVGTESEIPVRLPCIQPTMGLEPLAVFVHQRHKADGHIKDISDQSRQIVIAFFMVTIQYMQRMQAIEALFFTRMRCRRPEAGPATRREGRLCSGICHGILPRWYFYEI